MAIVGNMAMLAAGTMGGCMRHWVVCAVVSIGLVACSNAGGDGAGGKNVLWEAETTIESMDIDGQYLEGDALPPRMQASKTEQVCGVSWLVSKEEVEKSMEQRIGGSCEMERFDNSPTGFSGKGKCDQWADASLDTYPDFVIEGTRTKDDVDGTVAIEGGANNPETGQRTWIKVVARIRAHRIGDC